MHTTVASAILAECCCRGVSNREQAMRERTAGRATSLERTQVSRGTTAGNTAATRGWNAMGLE